MAGTDFKEGIGIEAGIGSKPGIGSWAGTGSKPGTSSKAGTGNKAGRHEQSEFVRPPILDLFVFNRLNIDAVAGYDN